MWVTLWGKRKIIFEARQWLARQHASALDVPQLVRCCLAQAGCSTGCVEQSLCSKLRARCDLVRDCGQGKQSNGMTFWAACSRIH